MRFVALGLVLLASPFLAADEGMWLFNAPPVEQLRARYGFEPSASWLEHLRRASVRFANGGSGAFVSPDALIVTNHHIGLDCLHQLSDDENDLVATGYRAQTRADELPCPAMELHVVVGIEDVTARVNAAGENVRAREETIARLEAAAKPRGEVVELYGGAAYHLYRYHEYTDVRLVFAPEEDAALFGGDADNFEYPRYNFDVCFLRAYENDRPAKIEHWLRWNADGAKEGDLVFASGNPGITERGKTVTHILYARDVDDPLMLERTRRREQVLRNFSQRSAENARRAMNEMLNLENARKGIGGELAALQDPALIAGKRAEEARLRERVNIDAELQAIDRAVATARALHLEMRMFESGWAFDSALFSQAREIVRYAADKTPDERARQALLIDMTTFTDLDARMLADSLSFLMEKMPNDPLVEQILAGKSPRARAAELVRGTKIGDVAVRRALLDGGAAAIDASKDPMILLAKLIEPRARALTRRWLTEVEDPLRQAYTRLAHARLRAGTALYPDATFTLRLSFGRVLGYVDEEGVTLPWATNLAGLYERAAARGNAEPHDLPERWLTRKTRVDLTVPINFVTAIDTVGGSSGSPLVNRSGEVVGLVFDGNLPTLGFSFAYQERDGRTIAVHTRGIVEILRAIYGATELLSELGVTTNA